MSYSSAIQAQLRETGDLYANGSVIITCDLVSIADYHSMSPPCKRGGESWQRAVNDTETPGGSYSQSDEEDREGYVCMLRHILISLQPFGKVSQNVTNYIINAC